MLAMGQEGQQDAVEQAAQKAEIMSNVAQYRDQLFDEGTWKTMKAVAGVVVVGYFVMRFLFKR